MTPGERKYKALNVEANLLEVVKLEYAMKKHFVYIDNIDELRHVEGVIREFDKAIRIVRNLMRKLKIFRNSL